MLSVVAMSVTDCPALKSFTASSAFSRAVGLRPRYRFSALAFAIPSRWRSSIISRSNCAKPAKMVRMSLPVALLVSTVSPAARDAGPGRRQHRHSHAGRIDDDQRGGPGARASRRCFGPSGSRQVGPRAGAARPFRGARLSYRNCSGPDAHNRRSARSRRAEPRTQRSCDLRRGFGRRRSGAGRSCRGCAHYTGRD